MNLKSVLKPKSFFSSLHNATKLTALPKQVKEFPTIWLKNYYKEYVRFPRILLPTTDEVPNANLFTILTKRKSVRNFKKNSIDLLKLSVLLFYSAGINRLEQKNLSTKRFYPSGGARYPLEVYIINLKKKEELPLGIYHYNVKFHALELIQPGSFQQDIKEILGEVNQELASSPTFIVVTAVFGRTEIKYGKTTYRIILLEAGHLSQNLYLVSTALKLDACLIGGYKDHSLNQLIQLDEEKEQSLYLFALG